MDTITHGLSGALLGRSLSNKVKKLKPKTFILIGAFAATFPDFDFLFRLISQESYLANHRGITHSFLIMPIWAFLISYFFSLLLRKKLLLHKDWIEEGVTHNEVIKETFLLTYLGLLIHVVADIITSYGTMILSPFNNARFEIGSVYIIDLWFTGIIVAGIFASWFVKKDKYLMARVFLSILFSYVALTQHVKREAVDYATVSLRAVHPSPSDLIIYSNPGAFSPYNWAITAYDPKKEVYYISEFNIKDVKILRNNNWKTIHRWGNKDIEQSISKIAWEDPDFSMYRGFMKIPAFHSVIKNDEKVCVYFSDLRFSNPIRENPFVFGICVTKNGKKYRSHSVQGIDKPMD